MIITKAIELYGLVAFAVIVYVAAVAIAIGVAVESYKVRSKLDTSDSTTDSDDPVNNARDDLSSAAKFAIIVAVIAFISWILTALLPII